MFVNSLPSVSCCYFVNTGYFIVFQLPTYSSVSFYFRMYFKKFNTEVIKSINRKNTLSYKSKIVVL